MADTTESTIYVYVGTYSGADSDSIFVYRMDPTSGEWTPVDAASGVANPSFLAVEPRRPSLYSVNEVGSLDGQPGGGVSAFVIDRETGKLSFLNTQSSQGSGPCYVSVDGTGEYALVANYGSGSVAMLPLHEDGSLGEATDFVQHEGSSVNLGRQKEPHAHSFRPDPTNRYALSADLGLDKILVYRMDLEDGKLPPHEAPWAETHPGAGPRHFDFHLNGNYAYVINELDNTVIAYRYDAETGSFQNFQTLTTLPESFSGTSHCADIHVHPSGKFLYGSNRGHDSIVIFGIDEQSGKLSLIGHESTQGKNPRNFALDPSGTFLYVANQDTNNIVAFRIDAETGKLTPTGQIIEAPKPVCIQMLTLPG